MGLDLAIITPHTRIKCGAGSNPPAREERGKFLTIGDIEKGGKHANNDD